jgi:hypothetical protein
MCIACEMVAQWYAEAEEAAPRAAAASPSPPAWEGRDGVAARGPRLRLDSPNPHSAPQEEGEQKLHRKSAFACEETRAE